MKQVLVSLLSGLFLTTALAGVPVKHANCDNKINLKHPPNSAGVFFDADCKTVFVLPPAASNVQVTGLSEVSDIRQCEVVNSHMNIDITMAKRLEQIMASLIGQPADDGGFGSGTGGDVDSSVGKPGKIPSIEELKEMQEVMNEYMNLREKIEKQREVFANRVAASAIITFKLPWDKLVNAYKDWNGNKGLQFVRMPLDAAYLSFNRSISGVGDYPAVLKYDIPGIGAANTGIGDATSGHTDTTTLLVGDSYSGQLMLTLAGACPFYSKATGKLVPTVGGKSMTALLNANLNYSYGLQIYRKYFVKYNYSLLAKQIKESSSSGGFFSTSTSTKVINSTEGTDWFEFRNESNDARFNSEAAIPELKADAINRVIRSIAMAEGYPAAEIPQVQARTQNGAQVASDELQKCPNKSCQVVAVALKVLDSIFGSSSSVNTYINEKHLTAGDIVEENKVIRFYGSSSFKD